VTFVEERWAQQLPLSVAFAAQYTTKHAYRARSDVPIVDEQQQEIAVLHVALGDAPPPGTPAPTQTTPESREQ